MKISENPMESEFCILNVVSRIEAVANATRGGVTPNAKEPAVMIPPSRTSRNALYDGKSEDELDG
jgi:hypothetical protein